jgi:hypothetical protein
MTNRRRLGASALALTGTIATVYGLYPDPLRIWPNLLLNGFYAMSLGLSAMFFLSTQRATGARWSAGLRRIPEAFMLTLPFTSVLLLLVFCGRQTLYPWAHAGTWTQEASTAGRTEYLRPQLVFVRAVIALALFNLFAWLLRRTSVEQDRRPEQNLILHHRLNRYSILFLPLFAVAFTWTVFDWILSLDPRWFSTMFAIYVFAGMFVQGIAAITLTTVLLKERGLLGAVVRDSQLHDLGKMLFAFTTFWAYIWTCQYLLIWYGNIPEEITHYIKRTNGAWLIVFALNLLVNWVVPFIVLLPARTKRQPRTLKIISILLLCGHWLDLYVLIMPSLWTAPRLGVIEVFVAAGYASLLYLLVASNLARAEIVPVNDPILMAQSPEDSAPAIRTPELEREA